MHRTTAIGTLLGVLLSAALLVAQDKPADKKAEPNKKQPDKEKLVTTDHTATIAGKEIKYQATAGRLAMKTDQGKEKAYVFFIAYTQPGAEVSQRPVTFCFNGGPGSSSVWLHLGMLGPQRVRLPDDASQVRPPHHLEANPYSLLDITDLVFIDPVSTGYSRPAGSEDKRQFHGYDEDLRSVGQFIEQYTTRFERWPSPKFLIGESYGGLRAAGLAGHLQERYRMELNGIVLLSAVVNFQTLAFGTGNDLPYLVFLPSYTATAWYHKVLSADLQKKKLADVVGEAEQFVLNEYGPALLKGDALTAEDRAAVAAKLARYSGLTTEYVLRANLRVSMSRFAKELLRDRARTVGRFDSRYLGIDRDDVGSSAEYDPSGSAVFGAFTAAINNYVRHDLKFEEELVYEILTGNVHPWNYGRFENRYVNASETLRDAMTSNQYLKVFCACGYYDLATPHFAMEHTISHLGLHPSLRDNVTFGYYEGGHMMYVYQPALVKLRKDLLKFYAGALGKQE